MSNSIRLMTQVTTHIEIRNSEGNLTDPVALGFNIRNPSGVVASVSYPNSSIEKIAVGIYEISIILDEPGVWSINAQAENPTVSTTETLYCTDRFS